MAILSQVIEDFSLLDTNGAYVLHQFAVLVVSARLLAVSVVVPPARVAAVEFVTVVVFCSAVCPVRGGCGWFAGRRAAGEGLHLFLFDLLELCLEDCPGDRLSVVPR